MENYYEVLNVRPTASDAQIRNAFKKLAIQYHPDKIRGNSEEVQEEAHRRMSLINEAYRTLIDPEKKKDYDVWLAARTRAKTPTPRSAPTPPTTRPDTEWLGTMEWQKPGEIQAKERRSREQILSSIESLVLSRVDELNWQRIALEGWNRAYQGTHLLRKYRIAFRAIPEITNANLDELEKSMEEGKTGLAGRLLGPTYLYVVCFHEIIDHAGIYDLFVDINRDKTRRYLALVNLRYRRIDPPQVSFRDKVMERTLACLWVRLE